MATAARNPAGPGSFRELARISVPLILSSGSLSLQMVIDRIFLTWSSTEALAASMPAGMLHWTCISMAFGTATYVNTFVAQYHGAGKPDRIAASIWQGIYFCLLASIFMLALIPFSYTIFESIGHDTSLRQLEADYFSILNAGALLPLLATTLSAFFTGRGQTMVILWANLASTAVNAVFDYLLIFGLGPIPAMGIQGAAIATVMSSAAPVAVYAYLMTREEMRPFGLTAHWRFDRDLFGRLIKFGVPSGFHMFMDVICFSLFILLVGRLGKEEMAATSLAFNLNTLAFVPMFGLGTAVMTLVGQRIGEEKPNLAVRTTWMAFGISFVYMTAFGAIYLLMPDLILSPYAAHSEPEQFARLKETVVDLLKFVALYGIFDAMVIIFGASVRGAGDTKFSMIFSGLCGWFLMVVPTFVALVYFDGGLRTAWAIITLYLIIVGFGYLFRFQGGKWKSMRVIESEPAVIELDARVVDLPEEVEPLLVQEEARSS
ncbi:MAG: MATE family efflux transporter [Planctomycetota bacterium]